MWSPSPATLSAVPVARRRGHTAAPPARAWPAHPPPPFLPPSLARAEGSSQGLGKAKLPKLKSPPAPSERLGVLTPLPSVQWAAPGQSPRPQRSTRTKPAAEPYSPHLGLLAWMACLACQYLLSPCVPSSRPTGLLPLLPGSMPPSPGPPGRSQDHCGTKRAQSELSPVLPHPRPQVRPGWNAQEPLPASLLTGK